MKKFAAILALVAASGCASEISFQPVQPPARPHRITLQVIVDTMGVPLGAYQLVILSSAAEARIVGIDVPAEASFLGKPHFDPWSFKSGATRITGYSPHQPAPKASYRLLSIEFEQIGEARSPVSVKVEGLCDTSTPPKAIERYGVWQSHEKLDFRAPQ